MASDKQNKKAGITSEVALAWVSRRLGKESAKDVAEKAGKSERTIRRYVADFDEFIRSSDEFQEVGKRIIEMIPKSLDVYDNALLAPVSAVGSPAVRVADNILKIIGVLIDRKQNISDKDTMSDADLLSELGGYLASSTDQAKSDGEPEGESDRDSNGAETPTDD